MYMFKKHTQLAEQRGVSLRRLHGWESRIQLLTKQSITLRETDTQERTYKVKRYQDNDKDNERTVNTQGRAEETRDDKQEKLFLKIWVLFPAV